MLYFTTRFLIYIIYEGSKKNLEKIKKLPERVKRRIKMTEVLDGAKVGLFVVGLLFVFGVLAMGTLEQMPRGKGTLVYFGAVLVSLGIAFIAGFPARAIGYLALGLIGLRVFCELGIAANDFEDNVIKGRNPKKHDENKARSLVLTGVTYLLIMFIIVGFVLN